MKVQLSGTILDQDTCDILTFLDTSQYVPGILSNNAVLKVTPPNFTSYFGMPYNKGALTLITPGIFGNGYNLPSGVYKFEQSVNPNAATEVTWYHLSICPEMAKIAALVCDIELDCKEGKEKLAKLMDIKLQLDIAQKLVADGCVKKGVELFNVSIKQIERASNHECVNC